MMTAERYDEILALGVVILSRLSFSLFLFPSFSSPLSSLLYDSMYLISISNLKMCCEG